MRQQASSESVRSARHRFFEVGQSPRGLVSDTILQSWQRCRASGLAAERRIDIDPVERAALDALRQQYDDLRRLCRPEVEALYGDAKVTGSVVILTAPTGLILDAIGNADFLDKAARVALRPGVSWNEEQTGTNAIGTALHEHRPVEVRGAEHYFGAHRMLSCSASPILDGRGRTVGVLDLSGEASVHHVHALGMVRFAVDQIERRMLERELAGREVIRLHADAALLGTHREGVLVFEDHKLVAANRYALEMLGVDWSEIGRCRYDVLFETARPGGVRVQPLRAVSGAEFQARRDVVPATLVKPSRPVAAARPVREPAPIFDSALDAEIQRGVRLLEADIPILLHGETGTGKEVVARELHRRSNRAGGPFVAVNCAALPENLIEAELFGYRAGAFTGARREGAQGLLRDADGGVLFLDEIGDMPLLLQSRLLRVLQQREVAPLGGGKAIAIDFAVIAATHRDLDDDVAANRFRPDLYFRIAQSRLRLPPLREHAARGVLILELWRELGGTAANMQIEALALARLTAFPWPGNMRQLIGVLRALMALGTPGRAVDVDDLPPEVRTTKPVALVAARDERGLTPLEALERDAMQTALRACAGNVSEAARRLGVSRSTLYRKLGGGE
jgi:transcriptional regulator of acetoin/glycerol metabolism